MPRQSLNWAHRVNRHWSLQWCVRHAKAFWDLGAVDAVIHAAYQVPDEPAVSAGEDGDRQSRRASRTRAALR